MFSDKALDKWAEFELMRINRSLVSKKKSLKALLKEETPQCMTREGEILNFDVKALRILDAVLNEGEDLQIPITLNFASTASDSCYVSDEAAATVLRRLEGFGEAYPFRDGKMWLPNSLAYSLIQKYPTVLQALLL